MQPMGNYAYSIAFSDGHDTGIFAFDLLRQLGEPEGKRVTSTCRLHSAASIRLHASAFLADVGIHTIGTRFSQHAIADDCV